MLGYGMSHLSGSAGLSVADLRGLTSGQLGIVDTACPECGPSRRSVVNRSRTVLRIWDNGQIITYKCARCGISGWARDDRIISRPPSQVLLTKPDRSGQAEELWRRSLPLEGSLAAIYLRSRKCFVPSSSIRFLPAERGYPPTMIARFGVKGAPKAVHLTRLNETGTGKAGTDKDKIVLGSPRNLPIVVQRGHCSSLVITEGIEDAASLALCEGWSCWAAGSAGAIHKVLVYATGFSRVYIAADEDEAGEEALRRARKVLPQLIALKIKAMTGYEDANMAICAIGPQKLSLALERGANQDQ